MPKIIRDEEERRTPYSVSLARRDVTAVTALAGTTNLSEALSRAVRAWDERDGRLAEAHVDVEGEVTERAVAPGAEKVYESSAAHKGAYPRLWEMLSVDVKSRGALPAKAMAEEFIPALHSAGFRVQEIRLPDADYYAVWVAPPGNGTVGRGDVERWVETATVRDVHAVLGALCRRLDAIEGRGAA